LVKFTILEPKPGLTGRLSLPFNNQLNLTLVSEIPNSQNQGTQEHQASCPEHDQAIGQGNLANIPFDVGQKWAQFLAII
jgi:hypothetical protein